MITVLNFQANVTSNHNLLAIPVGIKQKYNVDMIVKKVLYSIYVRPWSGL